MHVGLSDDKPVETYRTSKRLNGMTVLCLTSYTVLYVFFWVIPWRLNFICRRFRTLCLFHLHRLVGDEWLNLRIVWVANGRSFGSKIACVNSKEGDLLSHGPPWHEPYLFHIPARGRYVGPYPFTTCYVTGPIPTPSPSLLLAQAIFEPNLLPLATQTILKFSHSSPTSLWRWNRQSVPKRRHIKFRRRGIIQNKTYNIQNMAKVWNQVLQFCHLYLILSKRSLRMPQHVRKLYSEKIQYMLFFTCKCTYLELHE